MNYNIFICLVIFMLFMMLLHTKDNNDNNDKNDLLESFRMIKINDRDYKVLDDMDNQEKAAIFLNRIDLRIQEFVNSISEIHSNDIRIRRLNNNLSNVKIIEPEHIEGTSSYTINKGEILAFCVRLKNDDTKFHTEELLDFVIIHELAHVMSKSLGHTEEWLTNFKFLLTELTNLGIYKPIDYGKNNVNYCGVSVTNNPYF